MVTLKVLKKFQDKDNKEKIYQVGETLSTSDLDRVNNLVSRGICSISAIKEANKEGNKPEKISLFDKEFHLLSSLSGWENHISNFFFLN